jgi:putative NADH-flavin reductase
MEQKTVGIIGVTGKVGKHLVGKAIAKNYNIKILVRNPKKISCDYRNVTIVEGDATRIEDVRELLKDCDVIISTVGQSPKADPIYSIVTDNVLRVMKEYQIKRYIVVSGAPVSAPGDKKNLFNKFIEIMMRYAYRKMMFDKQKELDILMGSDVDWTLVRLPLVQEGNSVGKIKESLECPPGTKINNNDIADFLISQINSRNYIKLCPFISN